MKIYTLSLLLFFLQTQLHAMKDSDDDTSLSPRSPSSLVTHKTLSKTTYPSYPFESFSLEKEEIDSSFDFSLSKPAPFHPLYIHHLKMHIPQANHKNPVIPHIAYDQQHNQYFIFSFVAYDPPYTVPGFAKPQTIGVILASNINWDRLFEKKANELSGYYVPIIKKQLTTIKKYMKSQGATGVYNLLAAIYPNCFWRCFGYSPTKIKNLTASDKRGGF